MAGNHIPSRDRGAGVNKVRKECTCGIVFYVYKSQQSSYRFCSKGCRSKSVVLVDNICETCGESFTCPKNYGKGRFCSDVCRKSWFSGAFVGESSPHWKGGVDPRLYSKRRRQAYKRGDKIDRVAVFEHFDWMCHLCDEAIDPAVRFPAKRCATIDHIVPLAKGGLHVWDNVAPAHWDCNVAKGSSMPVLTA